MGGIKSETYKSTAYRIWGFDIDKNFSQISRAHIPGFQYKKVD